MELGLHGQAYEGLIDDLEEQGFEAEIRRPVEQRGAAPQDLVNVALWLSEEVGRETLGVIIGIFIERMQRSRRARKRPPPRPPKAVLYGPNGDPLRELEIPDRVEE